MLDSLAYLVYKLTLVLLPIVAVFLLARVAYKMWLHYVQANFISGIDWVLLEIIPPREVIKSPMSIELFLTNALYHWSEKSGLEKYWQGAVWFWFSLEIVSIEGQVHFYIRTPTRVKSLIETQIYAQFPQAQVKVAEDYSLAVDKITPDSAWNLWGCEFKYSKPFAFPIKTYKAYELDKNPKEEYKIDPISPVIELFGSIGKGEQMWMQVVITPCQKKFKTHGKWFKKHDWVQEAEEEIRRALKEFTRVHPDAGIGGATAMEIRPPSFFDTVVKGATEKITKVAFETSIRVCYVAKKEVFNMSNRRNIRLIFRQYAAPMSNELVRTNSTQADAFGTNLIAQFFPLSSEKVGRLSNRMLLEYQEREFFHPPMRHKISLPWPLSPLVFPNFFHPHINIMNTEEIATIWHFPSQALRVPTLERVESKEAAPPPNLPV